MKLKVVPGVPGLFQFELHREPETESFASGIDLRDRFLLLMSSRSLEELLRSMEFCTGNLILNKLLNPG